MNTEQDKPVRPLSTNPSFMYNIQTKETDQNKNLQTKELRRVYPRSPVKNKS